MKMNILKWKVITSIFPIWSINRNKLREKKEEYQILIVLVMVMMIGSVTCEDRGEYMVEWIIEKEI